MFLRDKHFTTLSAVDNFELFNICELSAKFTIQLMSSYTTTIFQALNETPLNFIFLFKKKHKSVDVIAIYLIARWKRSHLIEHSGFHKRTKWFSHTFGLSLHYIDLMLVNAKLDVSGHKRIAFQVCRSHWFSSFLMAQR